jgi:protein-tyrosine phosphatase
LIDIHSHCLYGVDDGPRTFEQSVEMLELAAASGTSDIVASPHANPTYEFNPTLIRERTAELNQHMDGRIRIHSGCDFHLSHSNVEDALRNPTKYSINGTGYLLVELSDLAIFRTTTRDFERLQQAGLTLIITHPERNSLLRQRLAELADWVKSGCLLQVTADSLFGRFGSRPEHFAKVLLNHRMVHFVASDAHGTRDRAPVLSPAFDFVRKQCGAERAENLFVRFPKAVLDGSTISPEPPETVLPKRESWFRRFWHRK